MANTFRVITFAAEPNAAGTPYTIYTTPSSTTTVVIGLTIANLTTSQITVDLKLDASTNVHLVKILPIPAGSAFEYMSGNKIILQAGHSITAQSDTANSCDVVMSIMEIT